MTDLSQRTSACPDIETLAAFIDGHLDPRQRRDVEAHLAECDDCYELFAETARTAADLGESRSTPASPRFWYLSLAIAATVVLLLSGAAYWQRASRAPGSLDRLVSAVGANRFTEARLSGPFAWGPAPSPLRGSEARPSLAVQRAALDLEEAASTDRSPVRLHLAAVGALALGDTGNAITLLEDAARQAPDDSDIRTDLSAALLARWSATRAALDATRALSEAETAVQKRPDFAPALFNRALALEALGMAEAARTAWEAYLRVDSSSQWAVEARQRLDRPATHDQDGELYRERTALYREAEELLFAEWAQNGITRAHEENVVRFRARAVSAGTDQQLIDELDVMGRARSWPRSAQDLGIEAMKLRFSWHRQYRDGDHQVALATARNWLSAAAVTPLPVLPAQVSIALTEFSLGRSAEAAARLRAIRPELERRRYWRALARLHNVLGVIELQTANFSAGVAEYQSGIGAARQAGDLELMAILETLIGEAMAEQGDTAAAWDHVTRALASLPDVRNPRARFGVLATAAIMAADDAPGAAYRFADELLITTAGWANAGGQVLAHLQRATALARLGQPAGAFTDLTDAATWKQKIDDLNLAGQFQIEIDAAEARVLAEADPARAHAAATRALAALAQQQNVYRSASLLLLRGRASMKAGDSTAAERDWEEGARLIEDQRETIRDEHLRISRLDRVWDVFGELIRIRSARPLEALETLERRHARELLATLAAGRDEGALHGAAIYSWLPRGVTVLSYAVLPEQLLIWSVTADGVRLASRPISASRLSDLVEAYRTELSDGTATAAGSALAAELIPAELSLSPDHPLVVIPDGPLHRVSFATLPWRGNGRFLIERATVLMAPSLSVLKLASGAAAVRPGRALLVGYGRPSPDAGLPALPQVAHEVQRISTLYPAPVALLEDTARPSAILAELPKASVVHIAAHAVVDQAHPSRSRFIVAPEGNETLDAAALAAGRLQQGSIVMLSACESAGGRTFRGEGPLSLVRPFLAAGAGAVIGALWPIPDDGTAEISVSVHSRLARESAGKALASVQREAIAAGRPRSEWGAFVVYGGLN